MKKKLLALLLAAIMIVGILPTVAFAGELNTIDEVTITEVKTGNKASDCKLDVQTGNFEVVKRFVIDMSNSQLADNDVLAENTPYIVYTVLEANDGYVFKSAKYGSNYDADFTINGKPEDYSQRCFVTAELSKLPFFDSLSDPSNAKYALVGLLFTVPEGGFPEPSNDCTYTQKVTTPENGKTYGMKLNCKDKGEFTFEANGTGWNIKNSVGKYLNAANGKLVLGDTAATAWTYKSGAFSTTVKTTQKNNGYWLGFIYVPGRGTKTVTTTYYLNRVDEGSLSTYYVGAKLFEEVSGSHEYGKAFYVDATNHKYICKNCGDVKTEAHSYDETTHKCVCGAFDPDEINVKISVDVKEKTAKQYVGWGWYGSWKDVTTYTATIKTEATGVKVCKVEYQLNGSSKWIPGTIVCSDKPIEILKVRALGSNGTWYNYEYPEAPTTDFTVTFNMNGHGDPISSITNVTSGATIDKPTDPTAEGHVFKGWFKEEACENEWNFESDTVTKDTTLYAKWNITLGGLMSLNSGFPNSFENGWFWEEPGDDIKMFYSGDGLKAGPEDAILLVTSSSELTSVSGGYKYESNLEALGDYSVTFVVSETTITSVIIALQNDDNELGVKVGTYAPTAE